MLGVTPVDVVDERVLDGDAHQLHLTLSLGARHLARMLEQLTLSQRREIGEEVHVS